MHNTSVRVLSSSAKYSSSAHTTPKLRTKQFLQNCSGVMLIYSEDAYNLHVRVHDVLSTQICLKKGFLGFDD